MYEQLNLRDWPFRVTPDKEFGAIWAGRKKTKEQLERLLGKISLVPKSSLHLMWANFGMGKTHTLYHIEHLARRKFPQLIPIYAVLPKQAKGFLDVYRAIVVHWPFDLLGERIVALGNKWSRDLCLHPLFAENPDVANALLALFSRDSAKLVTARAWLSAQTGLPRSALNQLGVTRTIRGPDDAVSTLTILTKLTSWNTAPFKKVLLMIDEFQRIGELPPRLLREVNVGLHTYFNANAVGLELILSFSFGRRDNIKFMLNDELLSRADIETISLDMLTPSEAREFIQDLLSQFRLRDTVNPFAPFSPDAVNSIIQHIAQSKTLTPRRLMHYFNHVLQEWVFAQPSSEEVKAEDALQYLSSLELGVLDTDATEAEPT